MTTITKTEHVIDAHNKRLGILATEVAKLLIGKDRTDFVKYKAPELTVKVVNARLMDITEKKAKQETYQTYSGYPSGQKVETLGHLAKRRGYGEVLYRTVRGMLPKNKLRDVRLKNLIITE
jgi:large subunit ribosomal protein L13